MNVNLENYIIIDDKINKIDINNVLTPVLKENFIIERNLYIGETRVKKSPRAKRYLYFVYRQYI